MIVAGLRNKLPKGFFAEPTVQSGRSAEIDVSTFEDLPAQDIYEVRVYDERRTRLVAAIEIVSPANKDRPENRHLFVAKCAGLLRERVSVVIVDMVTTRASNLYGELLELMGHTDPRLGAEPPALYTSACRLTKQGDEWLLESWLYSLELGAALPTHRCGWPTISRCPWSSKKATKTAARSWGSRNYFARQLRLPPRSDRCRISLAMRASAAYNPARIPCGNS